MNNLQRAIKEVTNEKVELRVYGTLDGTYLESEDSLLEFIQRSSAEICDLFKDFELEITNNLTCITIRYKHTEVNLLWMNNKWVSLIYPLPNELVLIVPKQDLIREYVLQRIEWLLNQ